MLSAAVGSLLTYNDRHHFAELTWVKQKRLQGGTVCASPKELGFALSLCHWNVAKMFCFSMLWLVHPFQAHKTSRRTARVLVVLQADRVVTITRLNCFSKTMLAVFPFTEPWKVNKKQTFKVHINRVYTLKILPTNSGRCLPWLGRLCWFYYIGR